MSYNIHCFPIILLLLLARLVNRQDVVFDEQLLKLLFYRLALLFRINALNGHQLLILQPIGLKTDDASTILHK